MLISTCFQWISLKIWYQAINSTSPSTTFQVCFWYLLLLMPIVFMESIEADADIIPFSMISIENMISGFVPTSIQYLPQLHFKSSPFGNTNALRQQLPLKNTSKRWNWSDFISQIFKNTSKRWNLSDFISQIFKNTSKSWNLSDSISQTSKNTSKSWNLSDFISQTFAVVYILSYPFSYLGIYSFIYCHLKEKIIQNHVYDYRLYLQKCV